MGSDTPKTRDTGQIGPKPSADAVVCQTPAQPDVPACMLARSNSVHTPIFGKPSEPQSTSRKLPSMAPSAFKPADSKSPWAKIRAKIAANNANGHAQPLQGSTQSPPSMALDTLNDDQALALLLKNDTVAALFQNAFNTRVEEHQQKVERAYNQRLLELEEYTRSWRDTTKELWLAVGEGTFNLNKDQQESLNWKGPQKAGHGFNPEPPMDVQELVEKELVEKEFDSDGRVACITVKHVNTSQSDSHLNLPRWTNSNGCGSKDFQAFAIDLFVKKGPPRLVFRYMTKFGTIKYRSLDSTIQKVNRSDVVMELTHSNAALLGKAFCYLKDTSDRILQQVDTDYDKSFSAAELSFLSDRFALGPTTRLLDVLRLYDGTKRVISDLFAVNINVSVISKRLLIARPRYTVDGYVRGANFFDVGRGAYTTRQKSDEDVILNEDKVTFLRLAQLLCFSIDTGIVPLSLGATKPMPNHNGTSSEAGCKSTGLRSGQEPRHSSASIVPDSSLGGPSEEWVTDIKGLATDFLSPGPQISLWMGSPHLEDQELSKFLKTPPSCGRILFRHPGPVQNYTYFSWKGDKLENSPELKRDDIVIEFMHQNMFLLWEAFCLMRNRSNYLISKVAGPLFGASRQDTDDLYDKVDQHYRGSLSPKKQKRSIRSVFLPYKASPGGGIYDSQAEGTPFNRKVMIARPYHQGKRVIGAEFFDAGSGFRKARVSAEEIVLTEETATLTDLGRLLEQTIHMGIFPAIGIDHAETNSTTLELIKPKSGLTHHMPQDGEPKQSVKSFVVEKTPLDTSKALHNGRLEQQKRTPASKNLAAPQPSLFQRTLDLSNGLKELRDESGRDQSKLQTHSQWLAIGGEAQDVRSPSPTREQDKVAPNRSQAHGMEEDVLSSRPIEQHRHEIASDGSENSDLIILDSQPKNVTFSCRQKRPLSTAGQKTKVVKRPKLTIESSMELAKKLPQDDPSGQAPQDMPTVQLESLSRTDGGDNECLGEPVGGPIQSQSDREYTKPHMTSTSKHQVLPATVPRAQSISPGGPHPLASLSPVFLSGETIARRTEERREERRELREQLRQLGCRIEDDFDQADESTVGGNMKNFGQLQADGAIGRAAASSEAAASHQLREKLRRIGCRFESDIDKVDESNNIGKVAKIEQLRKSTEQLEPMPETERRIENTQANLRSAAHLPSSSAPNKTEIPSGDSDSRKRVMGPQKILTDQSGSTPVQDENLFSSVDEDSPLVALAGPQLPPRIIPTEPKAFRGVPKEPRAMRPALPQQLDTCSPPVAYPHAVSVDPIFQHQSSQEKVSLIISEEPKRSEEEYMEMAMMEMVEEARMCEEEQIRIMARNEVEKKKEVEKKRKKHIAEAAASDAKLREQKLELEAERIKEELQIANGRIRLAAAPKGSLALPNQVNAARFMNRDGSTALHNHQQPLRAVMSSPPPSRHGHYTGPMNSNPFAMAGRRSVMPIGLRDHNTYSVPEFYRSVNNNEDEGEVE